MKINTNTTTTRIMTTATQECDHVCSADVSFGLKNKNMQLMYHATAIYIGQRQTYPSNA